MKPHSLAVTMLQTELKAHQAKIKATRELLAQQVRDHDATVRHHSTQAEALLETIQHLINIKPTKENA